MERLLTANVKKSKEILAEVIELLEDLQQIWNQMLEQANPSRPYIQTAKATDSSLNIAVE
jgi:flagellin-specific chaperone FliS